MTKPLKYKATIERNAPMPSMCELCTSIHKEYQLPLNLEDATQNPCFINKLEKLGLAHANLTEEQLKAILYYEPFTNSKRKIKTTCGHFAHLKRITET